MELQKFALYLQSKREIKHCYTSELIRKYTKNNTYMKRLIKGKGLVDMLRLMNIGQTVDIQPNAYKITSVHTTCRRLKKEGKEYKVTEKGLITGCHVTRLR